jgi:hypothetical protein
MANTLRLQILADVTPVSGKTEAQIIAATIATLPTTALQSAAVTMATIASVANVEVQQEVTS